ncbi:MAG: hypothetical protein EHM56_13365 [Chloroflexi bacterium]|nr:MAG: hypothetical protein EHM56_13365 [Chloroflexota bacterium]
MALQVEEVAPDLSWAEITIGGPLLGREAWVSADYGIPVAFAETSREEDVADGVPVFICGKGTYRYLTIRGSQSLMCTATAVGYDAPAFAWKVNGVSVSPPSSPFVVPSVSIPVTSHVPLPSGGETQVSLVATLNHALGVNSLTLTGFAADGNYLLEVEVTASESSATAADPAPPTSDKGSMKMTNVRLVYEDRYYADLEACVSRVKDIDRRFSKSRWPGLNRFLRPEDPAAERIAVLERILDDVRFGESPALAEQLSTVLDQVRFRMALGVNHPGTPGNSLT